MRSLLSVAVSASISSLADSAVFLHQNPGAGLDPKDIKESAYKQSYKDSYAHVGCIPDGMLLHGDKFGDNKDAYKLKDVSGVSIVHYTDIVAKLDRKPMTHDVCYQFCRTVHDMHFFGITNGRDCYCAPYFDVVESGSSDCDAPCDGDNSLMCGGKTKSDMFSMHFCDDTADDLAKATANTHDMRNDLEKKAGYLHKIAGAMQGGAEELQPKFGKVGDSAASGYCQAAKVFAGELEKASGFDFEKVNNLLDKADTFKVLSTEPQKAEEMTADLNTWAETMSPVLKKVEKLESLASSEAKDGDADLFYPAMYFVDKEFEQVPQTCGGDQTQKPILGSHGACASACVKAVESCVGFQYLAAPHEEDGLCFLLSNAKALTYYTGCKKAAPEVEGTKCFLKLDKFNGINLTPDKSGKNKMTLKQLKKADRCF